jgi:hypothetical protein
MPLMTLGNRHLTKSTSSIDRYSNNSHFKNDYFSKNLSSKNRISEEDETNYSNNSQVEEEEKIANEDGSSKRNVADR